jgi:transposase
MQNGAPDYKQLYEQSQLRITALEQQLQQLQKMIFGSRQERFVPTNPTDPQLLLDIPTETVATVSVTGAQKISYIRQGVTVEPKPLQHPGRTKLPESLRREEIVIEPAVDTAGCKKIGEEITEVLEYQPGELYVKQYRRIKYARPDNSGILIGELPSRPLPKIIAGEGLLAQIVIDKYIDHLPLHRQMQRFERAGVKLPYSTLTDWVSETCSLITPLFNALKAEVLQSSYLHADETPIKVIDKDKKGETHRGFYWVYQNSIDKIVFFDYQEGRGREGPMEILENFKGYLQTDGYAAYDIFDRRPGITLIHCMAHARRMFNEALDNDYERAFHALCEIQKLYEIERISKEAGLNFDELKVVRSAKAAPILKGMWLWMQQQYLHVLPKSAIGKALAYSMERWHKLSLYITDGRLKLDNNAVENSIRPVALGRKNYLFAGSHEAAKRSGMLYSLLGTCKMHGIEPYGWLKGVLQQIADHPINKIHDLLPHRYRG